ncbi:c-type cytochrome [Lacimicrobium alkaliphilum]|uniref:Cytochrome c n=1 Tax=Lacimicrobium alkaliphilum TaxID=1526571 RepID=A0ABQ1RAY8_9ALTE|nr:cytochrome c [Lacimicrobium alkaliphilum]GGD62419.1 cytochrome c [Lacimicrobium alkaliphilum]
MKYVVLVFALVLSAPGMAADIDAGKTKSSTCANCHGRNGISAIPMYPNLAGQKEAYLAIALKAYRDGTRKNMVMGPMAQQLSDEDIADLAAYFASLDPSGK